MIFKKGPKSRPTTIDDQKTVLVGPSPSQRRPAWPAREEASAAARQETENFRERIAPIGTGKRAPDSTRTRIVSAPERTGTVETPESGDAAHDPVAGWLVIVSGPGRGRSLEIGPGMNAIGRAPDQRILIDFGDEEISRNKHAAISFDVRTSRFFLAHGEGKNLTYIGGDPVLAPTELMGGETISMGGTELKFIRLCGPDFSWA